MKPKELEVMLKILFTAGFIFAMFAAAYNSQLKPESWGHMTQGRELIKQAGLPDKNAYSFAGDTKWDYSAWIYDAFIYSLAFSFGAENMKMFKAFLMLLTFFILYLVIYKRQQAKYITVALPFALFGAYLLEPYFTALPSAMPLLFIACFLYVLERKPRARNKTLYLALPFITLLWSNMHLSALAAVVIMLVYLLYRFIETREEEAKKEDFDLKLLLFSLAGTAAAVVLNPSLLNGLIDFVKRFAASEWFAGYSFTKKGIAQMFPFYVYTGLLAMIMVYDVKGADVGRRAELVKDSVLCFVFLAMALKDSAFIPWFLIISIPVISFYSYLIFRWDFVWPRQWADADLVKIKNGFYFLLVPLIFVYGALKLLEKQKDYFPSGAAAYISGTQVPKNLFSEQQWAGFLKYFLYPEYKVMYDGSLKQLSEAETDYSTLYYGDKGWKEAAAKYNIGSALLGFKSPAIAKFTEAGFAPAYFDDRYVIMVDKARTDRYFKSINPLVDGFFDRANTLNALMELESFSEEYQSEKAQLMTAEIYAASEPSRAIDYLAYMIDKFPENYKLYNYKGRLLYGAGDYENAYDVLADSKKRGPEEEAMLKDIKIKLKSK